MDKHFYHQYTSEETGKVVKSNLPSYCGKTPAVPFEWRIMKGWCPDCMAIFERFALGSMSKVIGKMSALPTANTTGEKE